MFKKINNPSFKILEVFPGSHSHFIKWHLSAKFLKKFPLLGQAKYLLKIDWFINI